MKPTDITVSVWADADYDALIDGWVMEARRHGLTVMREARSRFSHEEQVGDCGIVFVGGSHYTLYVAADDRIVQPRLLRARQTVMSEYQNNFWARTPVNFVWQLTSPLTHNEADAILTAFTDWFSTMFPDPDYWPQVWVRMEGRVSRIRLIGNERLLSAPALGREATSLITANLPKGKRPLVWYVPFGMACLVTRFIWPPRTARISDGPDRLHLQIGLMWPVLV